MCVRAKEGGGGKGEHASKRERGHLLVATGEDIILICHAGRDGPRLDLASCTRPLLQKSCRDHIALEIA